MAAEQQRNVPPCCLIHVHPAVCLGEEDNNPNQMLHSHAHLGPAKELVVWRLPMLPRQFSLNSGQGQQGNGGASGRERFWHRGGDIKAVPQKPQPHLFSWKLAPAHVLK